MHRTLRTPLATAVLLCLSQSASGGPIQWGYRAEDPSGNVLREVAGIMALAYNAEFMPDPLVYGTMTSYPYLNFRTDLWRSYATVTITDELSGQSGSFSIFRDFIREYEVKADGDHLMFEGPDGGPPATFLRLGGNLYTITAPEGELVVGVAPGGISATPEPATLALAALGLGGLGLARRIRRT